MSSVLFVHKEVLSAYGLVALYLRPESQLPVISGVRCTSFVAVKDDVINAGGDWVDEAVVIDQNIITSRYVSAAVLVGNKATSPGPGTAPNTVSCI